MPPTRNPQVIVVGAGYAGLAAALALEDAGVTTAVLDARDRVGGRVWSVLLGNGEVAELGGEWIFGGYDELAGLIPTGVDFARRGSDRAAPEQEDAFLREAAGRLARLSEAEIATISLGEFLDGVPGDADAGAVVRARLLGTCAIDLGSVALAAVRDELLRPGGAGPSWRLAGGNQELAARIAGELDDVRLGGAVVGLAQTVWSVDVTVQADDASETLSASAAVVTVPAPLIRGIDWDPPLPEGVRSALDAMPFGVASKLAVPLADAPEPRARQSVDGPFWWWTGLGEDGVARRCVTAFAGSPSAQDVLATHAGDPGPWLERLRDLDPDVEPWGDPVLAAWASDPFARGAYSAVSNETLTLLGALEEPFGRAAFAGEHTAGVRWHGTMEGAIRSGRRAAAHVLRMLALD